MSNSNKANTGQLRIWQYAPKERTSDYFPTYAAIAKAMQSAMRMWVSEWLGSHPGILKSPQTAYPILFYLSTAPCRAKPPNYFTYDVQETEMLEQALQSATKNLAGCLEKLQTGHLPWKVREKYFPYRANDLVKYINENYRSELYGMFHVETILMDHILKFALINVSKLGFDPAYRVLRSTLDLHLERFSNALDLSVRSDELLRIATNSLAEALQRATSLQQRAPTAGLDS